VVVALFISVGQSRKAFRSVEGAGSISINGDQRRRRKRATRERVRSACGSGSKPRSHRPAAQAKGRRVSASRKALPLVRRDRPIDVAHVDGNESNGSPQNLGPTCRSCNAKVAHVMKRAGIGRRTRQYNPGGEGAQTLAQWMAAVMSMKGESDQMSVSEAVEMIHATPASARSHFAREIWRLRRQHGTAQSEGELPF